MENTCPNAPDSESLRIAMEAAWRDHHHARDQTWKSLQMEAALGAGLVTVDAQFGAPIATIVAGFLIILSAFFGIMITLNHRKLERRKFIHLMNCEELLGLHRDDIIPLKRETFHDFGISDDEYDARNGGRRSKEMVDASAVSIPQKLSFVDAFRLNIHNTAVFILRMHLAIMVFALVLVIARIATGPKRP